MKHVVKADLWQAMCGKQEDRRKKICPHDIITLFCEEEGDFFFAWFPKKCKKCK